MSIRPSTRRAIGTLATAVLVFGAVPAWVLTNAGGPHSPPSLDHAQDILAGRAVVTDEGLLHGLTTMFWVAIAWVVLAVAYEALSWVAGSRRTPSVLRPIRPVARPIVAAAAVVLASLRQMPVSVALSDAAPVVAVDTSGAASPAEARPPAAESEVPAGWEVHTVRPGEYPWKIAQDLVPGASRLRVSEVTDAIVDMNLGRTQPSYGGKYVDPDRVHPGWTLLKPARVSPEVGAPIPAAVEQAPRPGVAEQAPPAIAGESPPPRVVLAEDTTPRATTPTSDAGDEVVMAPGGHLWRAAEEHLEKLLGRPVRNAEVLPYWTEVIEANRDRLRDSNNPSLVYPGQDIRLPPLPGSPPTSTPLVREQQRSVAEPVGPDNATPGSMEDAAAGTDESGHQDRAAPPQPEPHGAVASSLPPSSSEPSTGGVPANAPVEKDGLRGGQESKPQDSKEVPAWMAPVGLLGATALATWTLREARRRRGRRLRRLRAGQVFPPPDPTFEPTARAVRGNADMDALDRLETALRHLATTTEAGTSPNVVVRHPNNDIEVLFAEGVYPARTPWEARADSRIWVLPNDALLPEEDPTLAPCPALVQLGTTDDGAELYVDLEALGGVGLTGGAETARQIARALTATLLVSPWARFCRLLTFGFDPYGFGEDVATRLLVAESLDALLDEAEGARRAVADAVASEGVGSSFRLRAVAPEEGWEPAIVVIATGDCSAEQERRLDHLATGGPGAAVVRIGEAAWTLRAVEPAGWWQLDPLGVRVRPVALAEEELRELAGFLAHADSEPVTVEQADPPLDGNSVQPLAVAASVRETHPYEEPDWRVMIRLLGVVDIVNRDGATVPSERDQPLELLAWLGVSRGTSTRTAAADALWAGRDVAPQTVRNVISSARNLLRSLAGDPPDGQPWIPMRQERLALHSLVVTDLDLLRHRLAYAERTDGVVAVDVLADGLDLLRGVPLEGQHWLWADEGYLASSIAVEVVNYVIELATRCLGLGDVRGALAATTAGLRVIPLHNQLTELSMHAWIADGNPETALAMYEAYERATAARGESVDERIARLRNGLLREGRAEPRPKS